MTVMGSITNIARQRPDYFSKVVQAFEALQGNVNCHIITVLLSHIYLRIESNLL